MNIKKTQKISKTIKSENLSHRTKKLQEIDIKSLVWKFGQKVSFLYMFYLSSIYQNELIYKLQQFKRAEILFVYNAI